MNSPLQRKSAVCNEIAAARLRRGVSYSLAAWCRCIPTLLVWRMPPPFIITTSTTIRQRRWLRLYHGTDIGSAAYIIDFGLDQARSLAYGGGTFCATMDFSMACTFADLNPAGGPPIILGFDIASTVFCDLITQSPPLVSEIIGVGYEFFPQSYEIMNESMINKTAIATTTVITWTE